MTNICQAVLKPIGSYTRVSTVNENDAKIINDGSLLESQAVLSNHSRKRISRVASSFQDKQS